LSIDPLAALAETQKQLHDRLMEVTPTSNEVLKEAWQTAVEEKMQNWKESREVEPGSEQWIVLVTCRDEEHQVELLKRFQEEGLKVRALVG